MQQQIAQSEETLPVVVLAAGQRLCSKDPTKIATHSYSWSWGESGVACNEEIAKLQVLAPQLAPHTLAVAPLPSDVPLPPARDERIAWYAKEKTLELELEEAKGRGLELWRNNEELRRQNRLHEVRKAEADLERELLNEAIAKLEARVAEQQSENAQLLADLERAKTLAAFAPRGAELGLEGATVVDGNR